MFESWRAQFSLFNKKRRLQVDPAVAVFGVVLACATVGRGDVRSYPPSGEEVSGQYVVTVDGKESPVYRTKVAPGDAVRRWKAMDDVPHSGDYFDMASFAAFDMQGAVAVTVACKEPIRSAKVLPTSYKITPVVDGARMTFTVARPMNLTVEVNGDTIHSLHLFANPVERDVPRADDPNVIYFGPGIHEVREGVKVGSGKTVYIASGAVVRGVGSTGGPIFNLQGDHITLRGRGIIDGSLCPIHSRHMLMVRGRDIAIEGVILRDASTWNVPIRQSERVVVKNIKVFGCRANSDGIDICNSRDVTVEGCFLRTLDDLIVIKTDRGQGEARQIVVKGCVLWNQVAHALSVGAELRENVDDVLFEDCDVIHDTGREWTLRVFHADAATISNVRFAGIRIAESRKLISLWIGKAVWSRDVERGHIKGVTFENIAATANPFVIDLTGYDEGHAVEDTVFQNVVVNGKPLAMSAVKENAFVHRVVVKP
jgi:polygalacturonase